MAAVGSPPLAGIRVLDFSRFFAGPIASMFLADLGADVIKIEPPEGDDARRFGPPFLGGEGMNFMALNRGKRSVVLNLKHPQARQAIYRMAESADVVIENFRPGVAQRLGVDYAALAAANPRLVHCSITGFGSTGPYRDRPALDLILQGYAGVMDKQGMGGPPRIMVITAADTFTGSLATQSILAALLVRERSGQGQRVEVNLLQGLIASQAYRIISGEQPIQIPAFNDTVPYQAFPTADGYVNVAVVSERTWEDLCRVIGRQDLAGDPRFATNPDRVQHQAELIPLLESVFRARTTTDWLARLEAGSVPSGPVRRVEDLFDDPHVRETGMVIRLEHPAAGPVLTLGTPFHLEGNPAVVRGPAPLLGEHTDLVLAEVGYSEAEISDLRRSGAC